MFKNKNTKEIIFAGTVLIIIFTAFRNITSVFDFFGNIAGFLSPFIIGVIIAFIFNIPMKKIEERLFRNVKSPKIKKLKRLFSYLITLFFVVALLSIVFFIIVPQLKDAILKIIDVIPESYAKFMNFISATGFNIPYFTEWLTSHDINDITSELLNSVMNGTFGFLQTGIGALGKAFSVITDFFLGIIISIYILFQKETLIRQAKKVVCTLFSGRVSAKIIHIVKLIQNTFSNFLAGQCTEVFILGTMFLITMLILRINYAFLIAVLVSVCALIPIAGAFIAFIIGVILIAMTNPAKIIVFAVMFLVLQQIEEHLIYPHIVGKSIGLPGILVIFAVIVGGKIAGITGILTAIPSLSVIYCLFKEYIQKKEAVTK